MNYGWVGQRADVTGAAAPYFRQGRQGDTIGSNLHGPYYEQTLAGNVYGIGCALTALSAATILLTASAQPILGVVNPSNSSVNLVILQAMLQDAINNVTNVRPGGFVWAASAGNLLLSAFTAKLTPINRRTLAASGSQAGAFSLSTASLLTGLTNNLVFLEAADFGMSSALDCTSVAAATPTPSYTSVQYFDGALIVPPGGVLALLNTVSTVTHSVSGRLVWEEVPIA